MATSVSGPVLSEAMAAELGVGTVLGTLQVAFEGRFTGVLHGHPNLRVHKLERVRRWLLHQGQSEATLRRATFYSDSINDLALFSAVGRPVVVDPGPRLAATALRKGWRTLHLERTVTAAVPRPRALA